MRILMKLAALLAAATLAACTTKPIYSVQDAVVTAPAGKPLSAEQVKAAIIRAGAGLGWVMMDVGPGMIHGSMSSRQNKHSAEVEVPYSTSSYSINFKSSKNLNEGGGQIHKAYNVWIDDLARGINRQLALP